MCVRAYVCVFLANAFPPFSPVDGDDKGGGADDGDNNTGLLTLRFLHDDAFGSTRNRHGSSGDVVERYPYRGGRRALESLADRENAAHRTVASGR